MATASPSPTLFDPELFRRGKDLRKLLLWMQKGNLNKEARDQIGRATASFVWHEVGKQLEPFSNIQIDTDEENILKTLQEIGYVYIDDVFSQQDIADICAYLKAKLLVFYEVWDETKNKKDETLLENLPRSVGLAHHKLDTLRRCRQIYRLTHDPRLIRIMTHYLGAPPTIGIISSWWSFPQEKLKADHQKFHHDRGDFRSCNLFVYLTDVTEETGPHAYVERTHEIDVLLPLAMQRFGNNHTMFNEFWQWMEVHRKEDRDVARFFPANEVKVHVGPKGTSFLEDTRGLHKGTLPVKGPRLAFEIFFCVLPKENEVISPIRRQELDFPDDIETDSSKIDPLVRYANRLMYI